MSADTTGEPMTGDLEELARELLEALIAVRGWVVTCSESATAKRDLRRIDVLIARARATGASHGE